MSLNSVSFTGFRNIYNYLKSDKHDKKPDNSKINQNQDMLYPTPCYNKIIRKGTEPVDKDFPKHTKANYQACLLGGAIGDALGWPIEFKLLDDIKFRYGEGGIRDLDKSRRGIAEITDDTQMTFFTADGLLKSAIRGFNCDKAPDMSSVYESYQNWLETQTHHYKENENGWISNIRALWASRAPGTTCTGSLYSGKQGSIEHPINSSKGCGGVMRTAPAGLMYYKNPEVAFETGARCAALTHGNPSAYLPAGVHSCIIANIVGGKTLEEAVDNSIEILKKYKGHEETLKLLEDAKKYAKSDIKSSDAIKRLGEGWVGHEAIAIAVYCALKSPDDFENALIMSVNHNGDSDSTGAITGNILGAYLGEDKIPLKWRREVELRNELIQLANDLYNKPSEIENSKERYPV